MDMNSFLSSISGYGANNSVSPGFSPQGASNPMGVYNQSQLVSPDVGLWGANKPGGLGGTGLGLNMDTGKLALGGLQTIGSLWQAWEANKLAKEKFKFQKDFANTNLTNQIQSYNTTLADRTRSRTFTEGGSDEAAQAYIDEHSLRRSN